MSRKNFYICLDKGGYMPIMSATPHVPNRPCFIQYVNDTPVKVKPFEGMYQVWDYSKSEYLALRPEMLTYAGRPMPLYKGIIL